jgi:hypothetical protein
MKKELFALALAGTFMVPHSLPALGTDRTVGIGATQPMSSQSPSWKELPLPPVPYLDTMPWLASGAVWKDPQLQGTFSGTVDSTLNRIWRPDLDAIGPIGLQPAAPNG